jgi:hypothetical protein
MVPSTPRRVLVICPSRQLQKDISINLGTREHAGVCSFYTAMFGERFPRPVVYVCESKDQITDEARLEKMVAADIVVTMAQDFGGSKRSQQRLGAILDWEAKAQHALFEMVVMDEVHHKPAATWKVILDSLKPRVLLGLTATPFRHDDKSLGCVELNASFTLLDSSRLARPITKELVYVEPPFVTSPEVSVMRGLATLLVAKRLQSRNTVAHKALVYVRNIKLEGEDLKKELDGLDLPGVVDVSTGKRVRSLKVAVLHSGLQQQERNSLVAGFKATQLGLDSCIDVLLQARCISEGFDNPLISVAAILQEGFTTLSPAVQFFGRGVRRFEGKTLQSLSNWLCDQDFPSKHIEEVTTPLVWNLDPSAVWPFVCVKLWVLQSWLVGSRSAKHLPYPRCPWRWYD